MNLKMIPVSEVRTVATVPHGVVQEEWIGYKNRVRYIDYQPGNGTSYKLLLTKLEGLRVPGTDDSYFMVTWLNWNGPNSHVSAHFSGTSPCHHYTYVQEKLQCPTADALALAELICYYTPRHCDPGFKLKDLLQESSAASSESR